MNLPLIKLSTADRHFFYLSYYLVAGVMIYILSVGYLMEAIPKLVIMIPATLCATWLFFVLLFGKRDPEGRTSLFTDTWQQGIINNQTLVGVIQLVILIGSVATDILPNPWVTLSLLTGICYLVWVNVMEMVWKNKKVDTS